MPQVATMGGGLCTSYVDICNTVVGSSTVPTPYTNVMDASLAVCATNVYVSCMMAENMLSATTLTSGDESGTALGTTSGTITGSGSYVTGSATLFYTAQSAVRLADTTMQNLSNCYGMVMSVNQAMVFSLS